MFEPLGSNFSQTFKLALREKKLLEDVRNNFSGTPLIRSPMAQNKFGICICIIRDKLINIYYSNILYDLVFTSLYVSLKALIRDGV